MTRKLFVSLIALLLVPTAVAVGQYTSDFDRQPDRVWLGPDLWANPMEDWQVHDGRLNALPVPPTGTSNCSRSSWTAARERSPRRYALV